MIKVCTCLVLLMKTLCTRNFRQFYSSNSDQSIISKQLTTHKQSLKDPKERRKQFEKLQKPSDRNIFLTVEKLVILMLTESTCQELRFAKRIN